MSRENSLFWQDDEVSSLVENGENVCEVFSMNDVTRNEGEEVRPTWTKPFRIGMDRVPKWPDEKSLRSAVGRLGFHSRSFLLRRIGSQWSSLNPLVVRAPRYRSDRTSKRKTKQNWRRDRVDFALYQKIFRAFSGVFDIENGSECHRLLWHTSREFRGFDNRRTWRLFLLLDLRLDWSILLRRFLRSSRGRSRSRMERTVGRFRVNLFGDKINKRHYSSSTSWWIAHWKQRKPSSVFTLVRKRGVVFLLLFAFRFELRRNCVIRWAFSRQILSRFRYFGPLQLHSDVN